MRSVVVVIAVVLAGCTDPEPSNWFCGARRSCFRKLKACAGRDGPCRPRRIAYCPLGVIEFVKTEGGPICMSTLDDCIRMLTVGQGIDVPIHWRQSACVGVE